MSCYETLWEAVSSVDGAILWQEYLKTNGLNLIMSDEQYRGDVFVVQDDGLTTCDLTSVDEWPQNDCGQRIRELTGFLSSEKGNSLLMYHWLPGETYSSVKVDEEGYPTLLSDASNSSTVTGLRFVDETTVSLLAGVPAKEGRLGGFANATIVEEAYVCDENKGHVYVLDRPLYPYAMPSVNTTSLAPLEDYCNNSIYSFMENVAGVKLVSKLALGAYALPLMYPLTNPMTNVTLFAPNFDIESLDFNQPGLVPEDNDDLKTKVALYILASMIEGGYCPSDFGQDGLVLNTLAGTMTDNTFQIIGKQNTNDTNSIDIELLYGDNTALTYRAEYLGRVCYSEVYRLSTVIVPWVNASSSDYVTGLPFEILEELPQITSQKNLFNIPDTCGQHGSSPSMPASTLSAGAIAGIVLGSCAFVALFAVAWIMCRRRSKTRNADVFAFLTPDSLSMSGKVSDLEDLTHAKSVQSSDGFDSSEGLILKQSEVVIDIHPMNGEKVLLGSGKFGKVYRGSLLGSEQVAVKCVEHIQHYDSENSSPLGTPSSQESNEFNPSFKKMPREEVMREVRLLKSCRSKYIVSFMGVVFLDREVRLVTELMPSGDLWNMLRSNDSSSSEKVTWYTSGIFIAIDVASGLNYLHNKKRVVHLDLKSSNILLEKGHCTSAVGSGYTGSYHAKIADVGLSKFLPVSREYLNTTSKGGTWNWCAPEVILNMKCSASADMYSFGVVLWEICTGEIPVRGCMREVRVPEECPQQVADLISSCLTAPMSDTISYLRPSADEALIILKSVLEQGSPFEQ